MLELLSPAGSMEALKAAVQNGANAVYIGCGSFNARQGAKNFLPEELPEAVRYCHIRGVKVHLTLNTLVSDREMPRAGELILLAAAAGVDAFIVQDLGIAALCHQMAPEVPMHGSTQMSVHSLEGVQRAAELGMQRVVLARELPKEEIAHICRNSPVEIEVFVHGALCMCYSGQCYMSSVIGRRSGNRGQCAQPCRLPYGYGHFEEKYPLSLKDNCLLPYLRELEQMGVASLKIEGRMKRPEYVAVATRIYRAALDGKTITANDMAQLQNAFSRQGFTDDYYRGRPGPQMFGTRGKDSASNELLQAARATYENAEAPLVGVRFYAIISAHQPAMLAVQDDLGNICKTVGPVPEAARNKALTKEELHERLSKTGGTPFACLETKCVIAPNLSLPASAINAMRREVLSHLTAVRGRLAQDRELGRYTPPLQHGGSSAAPGLTVSVTTQAQITPKLLAAAPQRLYVPLHLLTEDCPWLQSVRPETEVAVILPRIIRDSEVQGVMEQLDIAYRRGIRKALVGNLGHISLARSRGFGIYGDFGLNLYNSRAVNLAASALGLSGVTVSFEATLPQIRDLSKPVPAEMFVYGRLPLMLTENCIIRGRTGKCACSSGQTKLVDRMGEEFRIVKDQNTCRSVLLNGKKLWLLDKKEELRKLGLSALRLHFTTENPNEVNGVLSAWKNGGMFEPGACTRGLYLRGIE